VVKRISVEDMEQESCISLEWPSLIIESNKRLTTKKGSKTYNIKDAKIELKLSSTKSILVGMANIEFHKNAQHKVAHRFNDNRIPIEKLEIKLEPFQEKFLSVLGSSRLLDKRQRIIEDHIQRVSAIKSLKELVENTDLSDPKNENLVQKLFEKYPWLINKQYISPDAANESMKTYLTAVRKLLNMEDRTDETIDEESKRKRPDLVFCDALQLQITIIELKATSVVLDIDHLSQLFDYMEITKTHFKNRLDRELKITGELIGKKPTPIRPTGKQRSLIKMIKDRGAQSDWNVRDYMQVLSDTRNSNNHSIEIERQYGET